MSQWLEKSEAPRTQLRRLHYDVARATRATVDLAAALPELFRFLPEPLRDRIRLLSNAVLRRLVANVLRDLHGTEVRAPHRALHVLPVGQAQMLLWRHVAEHCGAVPADHRRADRAGDVRRSVA